VPVIVLLPFVPVNSRPLCAQPAGWAISWNASGAKHVTLTLTVAVDPPFKL